MNVKDGAVWNIDNQLQTGQGDNSKTIINVENATVNLNNLKGAFLGMGSDPERDNSYVENGSTTEFNLLEGARLNVSEELYIGYVSSAKMTVAKTAVIKDFGNLHTEGTAYVPETPAQEIKLPGSPIDRLIIDKSGILENAGTIDMMTELSGGIFTMVDGAVAKSLTAITGTINLSGNVTFTGEVKLGSLAMAAAEGETVSPLTINIEQGTTLIFEDQVALGNAVINVLLSDEDYEGEQLFTIASVDGLIPDALKDIDLQLRFNGSTVNTVAMSAGHVATKTIPEPTTATLSLLALAGLAARRRRH